jgi:hypothetical protein
MMSAAEVTMSTLTIPRQNERRRNPRYAFTADAEIVDVGSGAKIKGHTSDFSLGGCYIDMFSPLPKGTVIKVRLTKWQQTLETQAKVVYSSVGMGMGLVFGVLDAAQQIVVESWLAQLKGVQPC